MKPNIFIWKRENVPGDRIKVNPEFVAYFYQSFGVPPELVYAWINEKIIGDDRRKASHSLIAYDAAMGTNYFGGFKD